MTPLLFHGLPLVLAASWLLLADTGAITASIRLGVVAATLCAALIAFWFTERTPKGFLYVALVLVAGENFWSRAISPAARSPVGIDAWLESLDDLTLALGLVSLAGLVVGTLLAIGHPLAFAGRLRQRTRRRAESELYGRARLLSGSDLRKLTRTPGLLLGEMAGARLVAWPLEGSAITLAPPRTGKGATIALNLLSPGERGHGGSTITIDPRGETYCIVARRRRQLGRRVHLVDPFGMVANHARNFPQAWLPHVASLTYNPLDFIRSDESAAVRDIGVLLDALMTPPSSDSHPSAVHFYTSAREIIAGYVAWIRFREPEGARTLMRVRELVSQTAEEREGFAARVKAADRFCGGLAHQAVDRQSEVGKDEAGSQFSTIANQLAFLNFPELVSHTARSDFDPSAIAEGDTDIFVVVPDDMVDAVRGWLRLWITIPNALANRHAFARDLLLVIDEMPRLGYLKPVMDAYNLAAGKGVHFWCFAQSISALDATWGKGARKTLIDLAEVVQILGFPRTDAPGAEELSRAIGTATFESPSHSLSGTVDASRLIPASSRWQAGESMSLVRERVVTPDELMTLAEDEQYVITAGKGIRRDAIHIRHARYWTRPDTRSLADPNPFVLRKMKAR